VGRGSSPTEAVLDLEQRLRREPPHSDLLSWCGLFYKEVNWDDVDSCVRRLKEIDNDDT